MKKLLALLLSVAMLLGACAFAEEAAAVAGGYKLSDIYIVANDQLIDLSNLALEADVYSGDDGSALKLHLDDNGETAAELGLTMVDGISVLHLESDTLGHKDFGIDPVVYLERSLRQAIDGIVEMLQGVDTTELAQSIMDFANKSETEEEEPAPEAQAPALPNISIEGDVVSAIQEFVTTEEGVHMGGVQYGLGDTEIEMPDGEYTVTHLNFDMDAICSLLNMAYIDGEPAGLGDSLKDSGMSFALEGTTYAGDGHYSGTVTFSYGANGTEGNLTVDYSQTRTDAGESGVFSIGSFSGDQGILVQFKLAESAHEGDVFTPASVDMSGVEMLSDLSDEEANAALSEAFTALGGDVTGAVLGSFMSAMMAAPAEEAPAEEALEEVPAEEAAE